MIWFFLAVTYWKNCISIIWEYLDIVCYEYFGE